MRKSNAVLIVGAALLACGPGCRSKTPIDLEKPPPVTVSRKEEPKQAKPAEPGPTAKPEQTVAKASPTVPAAPRQAATKPQPKPAGPGPAAKPEQTVAKASPTVPAAPRPAATKPQPKPAEPGPAAKPEQTVAKATPALPAAPRPAATKPQPKPAAETEAPRTTAKAAAPPAPSWQADLIWVKEIRNESGLGIDKAPETTAQAIAKALSSHPQVGGKFRVVLSAGKERARYVIEGAIDRVTFKPKVSPDNLRGKTSEVTIVEVTAQISSTLTRRKRLGRDRSVDIGSFEGSHLARRVKIPLEDLKANRTTVGHEEGQIPPSAVHEAIEKAVEAMKNQLALQLSEN